ncbi:MAG: hypothetical protein ACR2P4_00855 [Gammaproteobacteria bacterium]
MMKILFVLLFGCTALWFIGAFVGLVIGIILAYNGQEVEWAQGFATGLGVPAVFWAFYGSMAWACRIIDKPGNKQD